MMGKPGEAVSFCQLDFIVITVIIKLITSHNTSVRQVRNAGREVMSR